MALRSLTGFIGTDLEIDQDLSGNLPEDWRKFNQTFIPIFLSIRPEKTKIGAGLGLRFSNLRICGEM